MNNADLLALRTEREQAIRLASDLRVAAEKAEKQASLNEEQAFLNVTTLQPPASNSRIQLPWLLSLARATRDHLLAGRALAMCRVKELESVLEVLRDRVEEADVWVDESHRQVGNILNTMAVEGIEDSVGFSSLNFVDHFADISDNEFENQLCKVATDSEDSDDSHYSDCISQSSL